MTHLFQHETTAASLLHELDLGQHRLCLMSDGSIGLFHKEEQTSSHQHDNRICLDHDETYRLFVSLHELFRQEASRQAAHRAKEVMRHTEGHAEDRYTAPSR
ncbi:MAG: hypothetical protein IMW89_06420 [Ktedonobacteraceae bacterium]|nr:hypothetical protein [Ktedonobacteraceae bacterium]